jgi:hypothetical protein
MNMWQSMWMTIATMSPQEFISILEGRYKFKRKGSGPLSFHLEMDIIVMEMTLFVWHLLSALKR